ncbi:MAG: TIGR04076 family protein [Bacteroidales bacterium]|nr:TIGR04076 family protein [Bacteroidales bacterium]
MKKVKITALRQTVYTDLMTQYENPIEKPCMVNIGTTWISIDGQCPEGFCTEAWKTLQPFVEALAQGKGNFFDGWMKNPNSALLSCNDGFRPVSFLVETIE